MTDFPANWPRIRALAWDQKVGAACVWLAAFEEAGRLYVYREAFTPTDRPPSAVAFAETIHRLEKEAGEDEDVLGWTHPAVWEDEGLGRLLTQHGAYCRSVPGSDDAGPEKLRDWLIPESLLLSDHTWGKGVRLSVVPECRETVDLIAGRTQRPLLERALIVAVMSRSPAETAIRDSAEERERLAEERRMKLLGIEPARR